MKNLLDFVKTTALGGLVVIVPLGIVFVALTEVYDMLAGLTAGPAKLLPFGPFVNGVIVLLAQLTLIVIVCFAIGLFLKTQFGDRLKASLEQRLENLIPMYGLLRNLAQRLVGIEGIELAAAEIDLYDSEARVVGFIVEELPDGRYSVFVPISPLVTVGNLYMLPASRVRKLDVAMTDAIDYFSQWGAKGGKLIA
jgi:uncharacterized membrane protein